MGTGVWSASTYTTYNVATKNVAFLNSDGTFKDDVTVDQIYVQRTMDSKMNPKDVIRECKDTDEHPNTLPVILALDVTGSMGNTASLCAKKLNEICTSIVEQKDDVEIMIMAIGDFAYDRAPLQVGQFESDVRIAEWLDKIYFEKGGGGNRYESYSAAWLFGINNCDLDCWKRGQKGIIITLGDEGLNPYIDKDEWKYKVGGNIEGDLITSEIYRDACEKYDIYHIAVNEKGNCYHMYSDVIKKSFGDLLGDHLIISSLEELPNKIVSIITDGEAHKETVDGVNEISW